MSKHMKFKCIREVKVEEFLKNTHKFEKIDYSDNIPFA